MIFKTGSKLSETELTASVLKKKKKKKDPKRTRDQKNAFYLDETGQNVQIFSQSRALFLPPASPIPLTQDKLN